MGPDGLMTVKSLMKVCVSIGDVNCTTCARGLWQLDTTSRVDAASAATCWTQRVKNIYPEAAHGNGEVADNEVASHPQSANLSQEICAANPKLATLVSEVTAVAKGAVAIPGELLDEALQPESPSADVTRQEDFGGTCEGAEVEERREVSCAELAQAENCVVRDSISPTDGHRR